MTKIELLQLKADINMAIFDEILNSATNVSAFSLARDILDKVNEIMNKKETTDE